MKNTALYLGVALLFTHELDAMPNHEWRIIPILSSLSDSAGELVFLLAHVPLFFLVIASIASLNLRTRARARMVTSGFLIAHAVAHVLFSGGSTYEFSSLTSSALVYSAGLCGVAYLAALVLESRANAT